jgi:hypothetical protein
MELPPTDILPEEKDHEDPCCDAGDEREVVYVTHVNTSLPEESTSRAIASRQRAQGWYKGVI